MLCLNDQDIRQAVSLQEVIDRVEQVFRDYEKKDFLMPLRVHLADKENTLLLMPCFTPRHLGIKLVTLFPGNPARKLPLIQSTMILNDGETGRPLALMNGQTLTALRTGAVGGVGVRHFASRSPHVLGIVGAGVQGFHQALSARAARPDLKEIMIHDASPQALAGCADRLAQTMPEAVIHQASNIDELLATAQTVICATTSLEPVLPDDPSKLKGKTFIGIGSYTPAMREFPQSLFGLVERVFIDTDHAVEESGDLVTPLSQGWLTPDRVETMGRYLEDEGRPDFREQTSLFKSVGMALLDLGVSGLILQRALEQGLGQHVDF